MNDITLVLGTRTWDSILASAYGTSACGNATLIAEHMRTAIFTAEHIEMNLGHGRRVDAPADCWADLESWLHREAYHGRNADADTRRIANAWAALVRRIDKELGKLAAHPAYKGLGVMGIDRTVLGAWRCGKKYFSTARDAVTAQAGCASPEFGYLMPDIAVVRNRTITRWEFTTAESLESEGSATPSSARPE